MGKNAARPVPPTRKFPWLWLLSGVLVAGLGVGVLAIGWTREFDPLADKVVEAAAKAEPGDVRFVRADETEVKA